MVSGDKPQQRKTKKGDWSKAKANEFLAALSATCNVTEACRQSGVPITTAYRRRKADAAFRAGWIEAIGSAYQRLELALLDRAFNGTEKVVTKRDGSEERMREYSDQLGLHLLKLHRGTAIEAAPENEPENIDEIRDKLFAKLERLRQREEARGPGE